ncbi:3-oxoacyl-[acyl-carrier-protein] reductase FabG [Xanthomonas sacchari]|uniref:3-oxoacyl-ACP reductase FabG n=1 Tax=Xanthomonas TaxID=338 RepID=UPI002254EABB|nr:MULTISPECIES: 3-oxoacyl-ACP reductase FabG [Xanthomonas]MCW0389642.1 3-oxoacyl-[acyl-carrier-protein] reductase FabG [Xanthomonas sacchari]MCW0393723.1 3-oxoacyl-[acyl-carrier-protein] reductase FabG [Xanthomonas sacchari]MCW0443727.1 3-oxoacyl-[acyl-carrier-protein] reductase FabG [Xanthomonas sacchari]MDY4282890.1 3-oxoacyl-ACP reductase FabG [Xanthomonas sp. LF06-19]MDY4298178.1 3-oxoacyl-ACP reductase FabG [Xanthomonas sp. LF02-5]
MSQPASPRRALVTGGSGDLGGAICRALAAQGLHVIVHANANVARAVAVVEAIVAAGGSAEAVAFDVADAEASAQALAALLEAGPIQVLVNNAGIHDDAPMAGMSAAQWHKVIDVSLHGFFHVTQPLLLPMARTRWGRIVSVSSVSAVLGNRGQTNYAAAKAALHGASMSLAREMASRGISVNVVAPGVIQGAMAESAFPPEAIKQMVPAGRPGKPEEVAALIAFLCSDAAAYINGQVIGINGGMG